MPDPINIALSGLISYQRAIATVGNNIANANTDGYSRQTVTLAPMPSQQYGNYYVGSGVNVGNIVRATDTFATAQFRSTQASYYDQYTFYLNANQVDLMLADQSSSVATGVQQFFTALNQVTQSPLDQPSRAALLNQANSMVNRFETMYSRLENQGTQIGSEITAVVSQINLLASNIADINNQVIGTSTGSPELLDLRDSLIDQLSQYVSINVMQQSNGAVNISIGTGQVIVINSGSIPLAVERNATDPLNFEVVLKPGISTVDVTDTISGGQLGGLLSFRDEILLPAQNAIGQLALALAETFNNQHELGMDLNGQIGGQFFTDINSLALKTSRSVPSSDNLGTATLTVAITDTNQLMASDYQLNVAAGPLYILTRMSDNTSTTFSSFPQNIDGMTIDIASGALAVGDFFEILPTRNAANQISINITDPNKIAIASPIRTMSNLSNIGSGAVSSGLVIDTTNSAFTTTPSQLSPPVLIEFLSATSYQVVNANSSAVLEGPITFIPGQSQAVFPTPGGLDYGYRVDLSGNPAVGDSFTIQYNTGGYSDNRNGLLLGSLESQNLLSNSSASYDDIYAGLITFVGSQTSQANSNQNSGNILMEQAQNQRDESLGVNLDEEAASLLEYQHAYQAAGQVLSMASRLFDILFAAFGR